MKQTGLITKYPKPQDYVMGGETAIKYKPRTKDWLKYAPSIENQQDTNFDTLSCVSFSICNVAEFQLNYMIAEKELPAKSIKWLKENGYVGKDGKVNLSDRYVAIGSGTTERGNDGRSVAEFVNQNGFIPETDLPLGKAKTQKQYLDKSVLTQEMLAKGKGFLKHVKVQWEWSFFDNATGFNEDYQIKGTIEQAPLMLGITTPATHMTSIYGYQEDTKLFKLFDSYEPFFFENLAEVYNPQIGIRVVLSPESEVVVDTVPASYKFKTTLVYGSKGKEVVLLQRMLIKEGLLKAGLDTGNFLERTKQAVRDFQMKYGISPTGNVGTLTNAMLNKLVSNPKKK